MPNLNEPTWETDLAAVQKAYEDPSSMCNMRFTPSIVTGIILRLVQAHFENADNIRDDKLKQLIWVDDATNAASIDSNILIGPLYKYDTRALQQRPAILVFRQNLSADKFPLDSKTLTSLRDNGNFNGERYVVPINCTHVVRCIAKGAFAADRIGEEVFYRLLEYFPAIKQDFPFSNIGITKLTAPQKIGDDANENFVVDIAVEWVHIHGWTLVPIAPILKKVRLGDSTFDE